MGRKPVHGHTSRITITRPGGEEVIVCRICKNARSHASHCYFKDPSNAQRIALGKQKCDQLFQQEQGRQSVQNEQRGVGPPGPVFGPQVEPVQLKFIHIARQWKTLSGRLPSVYNWSLVDNQRVDVATWKGTFTFKSENPIGICQNKSAEVMSNYDFSTPSQSRVNSTHFQ